MDWYMYVIIAFAGLIAGFINTIAGSGSLITLPLLMFVGLPANVANGTNRIAIFLQNIVAVSSFKQQKLIDSKASVRLVIPSIIGAIVGANLAIDLDEQMMKMSIALLMIIMFFSFSSIFTPPFKLVKLNLPS